MPEQLLDRILTEIRERLDASRAAYVESQRLTAALDALGRPEVRSANPRSTSTPRTRRPQTPRSRGRARAPRGHNLRLIREAVNDRPGATAGEIASATGIAPATVASTLGKLTRDGELKRTTLPSGRTGFSVAAETPAAPVTEPNAGRSVSAPAPAESSDNPAPADAPAPAETTDPEPAAPSAPKSAAASKPKKRRAATARAKPAAPAKPKRPRKPPAVADGATDAATGTEPAPSVTPAGDDTP